MSQSSWQRGADHGCVLARFIPAWAGNTSRRALQFPPRTVHPRVGGEHDDGQGGAVAVVGSSPRGRGTHCISRLCVEPNRFIPAWAGNTSRRAAAAHARSVHPRVGGEHQIPPAMLGLRSGSSPRGRGTREEGPSVELVSRFIPAWAGNTYSVPSFALSASVHPRVGGEHVLRASIATRVTGSSPRGRGTRQPAGSGSGGERFIPAWAGNTSSGRGEAGQSTVHPRVGGEHRPRIHPVASSTGSSPRGRGTQNAARRD